MKLSVLGFSALLFCSQVGFARALPSSIICRTNDVTAVLRDFQDEKRGDLEIQKANLILTVNGKTFEPVEMSGTPFSPELPIAQMINSDGTTVIQLINANGQFTANFYSEEHKVDLQGKNALVCVDKRRN